MRSVKWVAGGTLWVVGALLAGLPSPACADRAVKGTVFYRTGHRRILKPDLRARVLLFRGEEKLALQSAARLRDFEKRYPEGLRRRKDRPVEQAARSAAMVLMTYDQLHKETLIAQSPVGPDGSFNLPLSEPGRYTLLIEAGTAAGSYHLKRYHVRVIELRDASPGAVRVDFGMSHLEHHHAPSQG